MRALEYYEEAQHDDGRQQGPLEGKHVGLWREKRAEEGGKEDRSDVD